jgi:DMSO/TMAO reductase YedYZ molybdopterin-dependent catalytic subunit
MAIVSPGFVGRRQSPDARLPPGQYLAEDFPVLTAGPTPRVPTDRWELTVSTEAGQRHTWSWQQLMALPAEKITTDIHCVTKWSKLDTRWQGVSLDVLLEDVETAADLEDLLDGQAWVAFRYDGDELTPEHGGPARLLVPHLYLWKSAKWVRGIQLLLEDEPGFWESAGYHDYGDPWREQRYQGD